MKKIVSLLCLMLACVFVVAGCGGGQPTATSAPSESAAPAESTESADIGALSVMEPQVWKIGGSGAPTNSSCYAQDVFAELIAKNSNGLITVEVYPNGQLGDDKTLISQVQMGSVTGSDCNTSLLSSLDPAFMVMDLPYMTTSSQELYDIIHGGFGDYLNEKLDSAAGLYANSWIIKASRVIYNIDKPINTPDDLKGMKLRIMENPVMARSLEALGAIPVPMPASERVMAMQTGVVQGCENSPAIIWQEKDYEVVKYISLTNHFTTPNVTLMSTNTLKALPDDIQKIVLDTGREAGDIACQYDREVTDKSIVELENAGLEINEISNIQLFVDAVKPVIDEYSPQIGDETLKIFNDIKAEVTK